MPVTDKEYFQKGQAYKVTWKARDGAQKRFEGVFKNWRLFDGERTTTVFVDRKSGHHRYVPVAAIAKVVALKR